MNPNSELQYTPDTNLGSAHLATLSDGAGGLVGKRFPIRRLSGADSPSVFGAGGLDACPVPAEHILYAQVVALQHSAQRRIADTPELQWQYGSVGENKMLTGSACIFTLLTWTRSLC